MDRDGMIRLCDDWLAAWHGLDPGPLLAYYAEGCTYSDPARPEGLKRKEALARYLARLLAAYPDMDWRRDELWPLADGEGFVVAYTARVTVGGHPLVERGMDLVLLDGDGKITRNDVYFDRSRWLAMAGGGG